MARVFRSIIIFCVFLISSTYSSVQTVDGKIKITIGTTSGCGDTVNFITRLLPVYEKYKQYLEVEFIPWGRTQRGANGQLWCQFGIDDCFANRLHRCALHLLEGDQDAQMRYMSCEFISPFPAFRQLSLRCPQTAGLNLIDVSYCFGVTGDALEEKAEANSLEPMKAINFVPFIMFNDKIDVDQHFQAFRDIEGVICSALVNDPSTSVLNC